MPNNHIVVLDNRPEGEASASNFKLITAETPALQEGQVLVKHHYLSLDPYMRGRMNAGKNYAQPQPLGEAMIGGTVGEVVDSKHAKFTVGQTVLCMGGWQEYSVINAGVAIGLYGSYAEAVARIFVAKERPSSDPLIVHLSGLDQLPRVARSASPACAAPPATRPCWRSG
jgi:NADPH-dependent curcumin reductase CurA